MSRKKPIQPGNDLRALMAQIPINHRVCLQGNCQLLFGDPAREPAQLNPFEQQQRVERKVGYVDPIKRFCHWLLFGQWGQGFLHDIKTQIILAACNLKSHFFIKADGS